MRIFNQTLEVLQPGKRKSVYGSQASEDWSRPRFVPVDFLVSVQPSSSVELNGEQGTNQTVTQLRLITPPGTDLPGLTAGSRVRVGGVMVAEVEGEPARWPDPYSPGRVHHVEAVLRVVRG